MRSSDGAKSVGLARMANPAVRVPRGEYQSLWDWEVTGTRAFTTAAERYQIGWPPPDAVERGSGIRRSRRLAGCRHRLQAMVNASKAKAMAAVRLDTPSF